MLRCTSCSSQWCWSPMSPVEICEVSLSYKSKVPPDTILTSSSSWWCLSPGRLPCWKNGFAGSKPLVASLLRGGEILQVPSLFLRDYQTAGQLNYSHFRDQNITSRVLQIFCKCWPRIATLCSPALDINGCHDSQKTGMSFPSCCISLLESTMGYILFEKSNFISFFPSFQDRNSSRYQAYSLTEWKWWKMRNRVYREPCIYFLHLFAPSPFVPSFWAVVRRTECTMLPLGRRWGELSPPGWRRLQREAGMGSESRTTPSLILCSRKGLFVSDSSHLGTCSIRQMCLETDLGFCKRQLCVHPHKPSCDIKLFFATLVCWYLICALFAVPGQPHVH